MRKRTKPCDLLGLSTIVTKYGPDGLVLNGYPQFIRNYTLPTGTSETMEDQIGYAKVQYCTHMKRRFNLSSSSMEFINVDGSRETTDTFEWPQNFDVSIDEPALPTPDNGEEQFLLRAFQNIRPKLKADVSAPNFLYELKDLKRLIPDRKTLKQYSETLQSIPGNATKLKKLRNLARDGSHLAAQQHLSAQFGYLPLIRDVWNLYDALKNFESYVNTFKLYAGKPQHAHYREEIPRGDSDPIIKWANYYAYLESTTSHGPVVYTFNCWYRYEVQLPKVPTAKLLAKFIGFRDNPRIIWDAIPFSFLIDWIYKVGKSLESFDDGAVPVRMIITNACVSKRGNGIIRYRLDDIANGIGTANLNGRPVGTTGFEFFERSSVSKFSLLSLGNPPMPVKDKLSLTEIVLGGSLLRVLSGNRH